MRFHLAVFAAVCAAAGSLTGCSSGDEGAQAPPVPVQVTQVVARDVPLTLDMVGTTTGNQDVPIRARVDGFLESMHFVEGRRVEKDQLLYVIDDQPFQAKLAQAESQLAVAKTTLANAQADLARIKPLAEMKAVSEQDLDSAVALEEAARSSVRAAEAAVELAEIELSYTRIFAPIDGIIGLTKAKPGEYVGKDPNPVVLNTLSDINPIRVRFSISEREYLIMARTYLAAVEIGGRQAEKEFEDRVDLQLLLADGSKFEHQGRPVATSQAIDQETGTYTVEAEFPNPDNLLLPGQFARVRAPYQTLENVPVIPRKAISELQGLYQVYVVDTNNTVSIREIQPGPAEGNSQVVESGLEPGETVIVEGIQKVRPGVVVAPSPYTETPRREPVRDITA